MPNTCAASHLTSEDLRAVHKSLHSKQNAFLHAFPPSTFLLLYQHALQIWHFWIGDLLNNVLRCVIMADNMTLDCSLEQRGRNTIRIGPPFFLEVFISPSVSTFYRKSYARYV